MSKTIPTPDETNPELELDESEIDAGDYGFIIGPDGELKHLFTPDDFELDPPPLVRKILKLLGIKDINSINFDDNTLH